MSPDALGTIVQVACEVLADLGFRECPTEGKLSFGIGVSVYRPENSSPEVGSVTIPFPFLHYANQCLITEGTENQHGLHEAISSIGNRSGHSWILELHRRYGVPANLNLSGTLVETIIWHQPGFLSQVWELIGTGLIEIAKSCYTQNIMRFYSPMLRQAQSSTGLFLM